MTKIITRIKKFMVSEACMTHHSYYDEPFISDIVKTLSEEELIQAQSVLDDGLATTGRDNYNGVMDYIVDGLLFERGYNTPICGDHDEGEV